LVGVQIVAAGRIEVLGRPAGDAALRSRVGYVTQAPSVYPDLTVAENVRYFAAVLGAPAADVKRVLTQVGLQEQSGSLVGSLSGGQRARVSLATALLAQPELLILDEPTVGLDPVLRRDLWQLFAELADRGVALLISSHVMDEAQHCQRLLLLRDGALLANGTPDEFRRHTGTADLEEVFLRLIEGTTTGAESAREVPS
jgi:ABC-2 type transport system ATP-binding protein